MEREYCGDILGFDFRQEFLRRRGFIVCPWRRRRRWRRWSRRSGCGGGCGPSVAWASELLGRARDYFTSSVLNQGTVDSSVEFTSKDFRDSTTLGDADAVRRCRWELEDYPVTEFIILPGHHLYAMDYQKLIQSHRGNKADVTISALASTKNQDKGFGILQVNSANRVLQLIQEIQTTSPKEKEDESLDPSSMKFASMGIYVVNKDVMIRML